MRKTIHADKAPARGGDRMYMRYRPEIWYLLPGSWD